MTAYDETGWFMDPPQVAAASCASATTASGLHRRTLIQIDGCEHRWFEDRGPACTLLGYTDFGPTLIRISQYLSPLGYVCLN